MQVKDYKNKTNQSFNNSVQSSELELGLLSIQKSRLVKHGEGEFIWADGSTYSGEFFEDYVHGQGTYIFSDGKIYTGKWVRNSMEGKGELIFNENKRYVGKFKNNMLHGKGTIFEK